MRRSPSPTSMQHGSGSQSPDMLTSGISRSPASEEKVFQTKRIKEAQKVLLLRVAYTFRGVRKLDVSLAVRKKFTLWKFHCQRAKAELYAKGIDEDDNTVHLKLTEKYLVTLEENENLRLQCKITEHEERAKRFQATHSGCARMLLTFWRCRILRVLGVAFHRWFLKVEHAENLRMSQDLHATLLSDQNTLGERKSKIKYVDELNSSLQLSLLVVLSVLRLRAHSFLVSLSTARKQDARVRTNLFRELGAMKEALHRFKIEDERATQTAIDRGKSYLDALGVARNNVRGALRTQKALKQESDEMNQKQKDLHSEQERFAEQVLSRSAHLIRSTSSSSSRRWAESSDDHQSVGANPPVAQDYSPPIIGTSAFFDAPPSVSEHSSPDAARSSSKTINPNARTRSHSTHSVSSKHHHHHSKRHHDSAGPSVSGADDGSD